MTSKTTYLYCFGLDGLPETVLNDFITLRSIYPKEAVRDLINVSANFEIHGLLISTVGYLTFEIEVRDDNTRSRAGRVWNAQWELVHLSILVGAPVFAAFTGDVSGIVGSKDLKLHNTYVLPHLFRPARAITAETLALYLAGRDNFTEMLNHPAFSFAASVLSIHGFNPNQRIKMTSVWTAIEGLLGFDHELRFRISLALSLILEPIKQERVAMFKKIAKLYDTRSKCVHGAVEPRKLADDLDASITILRRLMRWFMDRGSLISTAEWDTAFASSEL